MALPARPDLPASWRRTHTPWNIARSIPANGSIEPIIDLHPAPPCCLPGYLPYLPRTRRAASASSWSGPCARNRRGGVWYPPLSPCARAAPGSIPGGAPRRRRPWAASAVDPRPLLAPRAGREHRLRHHPRPLVLLAVARAGGRCRWAMARFPPAPSRGRRSRGATTRPAAGAGAPGASLPQAPARLPRASRSRPRREVRARAAIAGPAEASRRGLYTLYSRRTVHHIYI